MSSTRTRVIQAAQKAEKAMTGNEARKAIAELANLLDANDPQQKKLKNILLENIEIFSHPGSSDALLLNYCRELGRSLQQMLG